MSLLLNLVLIGVIFFLTPDSEPVLAERFYSGDEDADDKIAIVHIDGMLLEGFLDYEFRQIDQATRDKSVKAIVLRIVSPGGTVTASDELYRRILHLRDGTSPRYASSPKPIVVSMGPIATSGGYYVAMPARKIIAQRTTLTGSIGVYASFPNIAELGEKYGVKMELIKAGRIKASGSPFHKMTPQERQPWQEMVDSAYDQFLDVVIQGRSNLAKKSQWTEELFEKQIPLRDDKGNDIRSWFTDKPIMVNYSRYRADGGTFTADAALKYGLVDEIGEIHDAVESVAQEAGLSEYQVIKYQKPISILEGILGVEVTETGATILPNQVSTLTMPRCWYLCPQHELAAWMTLMGRTE